MLVTQLIRIYLVPDAQLDSKDIRRKVENGDIFFVNCKQYDLSSGYDYAAFHKWNRVREERYLLEVIS